MPRVWDGPAHGLPRGLPGLPGRRYPRAATFGPGPAVGLTALVALLATLAMTVGLGGLGWAVGLTCGVGLNAAVARGLSRTGAVALGPADLVTLVRATLACGVAALVADSFIRQPAVAALLTLTVTALLLDAVDGWLARRTGTVSVFGARFDGEADAFLMLVLSVYVAPSVGLWVLVIGAMRYVFAVAGWVIPWLRRQLPPRYWRKVVAGAQGVVLTLAAAELLPLTVTYAALGIALALLVESFGRDVLWLWRLRCAEAPARVGRTDRPGPSGLAVEPVGLPDEPLEDAVSTTGGGRPRRGGRGRRAVAVVGDVLALLLVWVVLVAPNQAFDLTPATFLRIPVEGLVVVALALVLPSWARRTMAVVVGLLLGLLAVLKVLDIAFFSAFDRPFNLVTDRGYLGPAVDLVSGAVGPAGAVVAAVAAVVFVVAVLVFLPLSVGRITRLAARHRRRSVHVLTVLGAVWVAFALSDLHIGQGEPLASVSASNVAVGQVGAIAAGIQDQQRFDEAAAVDRFRDATDDGLLTGLRGKDVLVVFVESYGRSAIQGLPTSPRVRAVLDAGTRRLRASGYSARSAFLTSPTFGGLSWLAHATLQSGLWVDNQPRYDRLLSGDRMTLSGLFKGAGWRTLAVVPSNKDPWPEGKRFYGFDQIYDRAAIEYDGPRFGWSLIPDQYVLSAFQRQVLAERDRTPVMAEVDLASSHPPWAPLPRMVAWGDLGDGSVFDRFHQRAGTAEELWRNAEDVKAAYVQSIVYSLRAFIGFVEEYGDEDLVVVLLGDHQPATIVSGHGASRDVPVTVIAHDQAVIDQIAGWDWQVGMQPGSQAPVWPMDAFRDRFLAAYSSPQVSSPPLSAPPPRP